jgi:hypothetical protein
VHYPNQTNVLVSLRQAGRHTVLDVNDSSPHNEDYYSTLIIPLAITRAKSVEAIDPLGTIYWITIGRPSIEWYVKAAMVGMEWPG